MSKIKLMVALLAVAFTLSACGDGGAANRDAATMMSDTGEVRR